MSAIAEAIKKHAEKNMAHIRDKWNGVNVDGNAEIKFEITSDKPDEIVGEYRATGQKMWIGEFGSGSKMDTENAGLSKYKSGENYNRHRSDANEIRTRKGQYRDLDGNLHQGSGLGGEKGLNAEWFKGEHRAVPFEARHIIGETLGIKSNGEPQDNVRKQMLEADILSAFGREARRSIRRVIR